MVKGIGLGLLAALAVYVLFAAGVVVQHNRTSPATGIDPVAIWHIIGLSPYLWGLAVFSFVWVLRHYAR